MNETVPTQLPSWLGARYNLVDASSVTLLRAYTNDVWLVESVNSRFVLKIYGAGWRANSEIRYEIDLLRHLRSRGIHVAEPIVGFNGQTLQFVDLDGQRRQTVLFDHAAGEKPEPPFASEMYFREGRAAAALHRAADDFVTVHHRRALDLDLLLETPLTLIESLDIDTVIKRWLRQIGERLRTRIEGLATSGLDWGPCHGDLTFDNFHLTDDSRTIWYDFDSGGHGWRAIDLQGWAYGHPDWAEPWRAFLDGYREVRPLTDNDITAAPYVNAAQDIWSIQVELERRLLSKGNDAVRTYITTAVTAMHDRMRTIGLVS